MALVNEFYRNEVIEKMVEAIRVLPCKLLEFERYRIAQAILDLHWDCKDCIGSGYNDITKGKGMPAIYKCPTCKGTVQGERMLAIIDPDQTPPDTSTTDYWEHEIIAIAVIELMIKAGWRKVL